MCKKAIAVDSALESLAPKGSRVEISAQFVKKWSEKARELGGSLSAKRIQKAIENLGLKVSLTPCAQKHFQSSGWVVNIGRGGTHLHLYQISAGVQYLR